MNYYDIKQLEEDPNTSEKLKFHCSEYIRRTDFMLDWYFRENGGGNFTINSKMVRMHLSKIRQIVEGRDEN
nr:hypothetical protein [uncultured Flavobacterium sp.]